MTSKQVMLMMTATLLGGCAWFNQSADPLPSVYLLPKQLAVAPLSNESGSQYADGVVMADHLAAVLENAPNISVIPVNRVLAAMDALGIEKLDDPHQARQLLRELHVDALVVGSITDYDPYDPPKLGIVLALYASGNHSGGQRSQLNPRLLSRSQTDSLSAQGQPRPRQIGQPDSTVSAHFNAASRSVRQLMKKYTHQRGRDVQDRGLSQLNPFRPEIEHSNADLYRMSMDLFSEFVSYQMSWRLLNAELRRVRPQLAVRADP